MWIRSTLIASSQGKVVVHCYCTWFILLSVYQDCQSSKFVQDIMLRSSLYQVSSQFYFSLLQLDKTDLLLLSRVLRKNNTQLDKHLSSHLPVLRLPCFCHQSSGGKFLWWSNRWCSTWGGNLTVSAALFLSGPALLRCAAGSRPWPLQACPHSGLAAATTVSSGLSPLR